jgi:hypothetical protein
MTSDTHRVMSARPRTAGLLTEMSTTRRNNSSKSTSTCLYKELHFFKLNYREGGGGEGENHKQTKPTKPTRTHTDTRIHTHTHTNRHTHTHTHTRTRTRTHTHTRNKGTQREGVYPSRHTVVVFWSHLDRWCIDCCTCVDQSAARKAARQKVRCTHELHSVGGKTQNHSNNHKNHTINETTHEESEKQHTHTHTHTRTHG